jgi:hypothetical protein
MALKKKKSGNKVKRVPQGVKCMYKDGGGGGISFTILPPSPIYGMPCAVV